MAAKKQARAVRRRTASGPNYAWDARGSWLRTLEASWYVDGPSARWQGAALSMGMDIDALERGERIASGSLTAISEPVDADSRMLRLYMHDALTSPEAKATESLTTHWHLSVRRVPSATPPTELLARSQRVGGYQAALRRLEETWPASRDLALDVSAYYAVDASRLKPDEHLVGGPAAPVNVRGRGAARTLTPRGMVWEFEEAGQASFLTVDYNRAGDHWVVGWSGHMTAPIGPDLVATLDTQIWQLLEQVVLRATP